MSKNITIITPEENVSCLPGYENFDTASVPRRFRTKIYVKSITELKFEQEKKSAKVYSTVE